MTHKILETILSQNVAKKSFFREFWLRTFEFAMRMMQNLYYSMEKSFLVISKVFETT